MTIGRTLRARRSARLAKRKRYPDEEADEDEQDAKDAQDDDARKAGRLAILGMDAPFPVGIGSEPVRAMRAKAHDELQQQLVVDRPRAGTITRVLQSQS